MVPFYKDPSIHTYTLLAPLNKDHSSTVTTCYWHWDWLLLRGPLYLAIYFQGSSEEKEKSHFVLQLYLQWELQKDTQLDQPRTLPTMQPQH